MNSLLRTLSICSFVAVLSATSSNAADDETHTHEESEPNDELVEIVVRAHPLSDKGVAQSYNVLLGNELARAAENSIGETLGSLAGVRNASFGPAVGRPVIHGLGGVRVKTMLDRTNTMDLSILNPDHPVTVNAHMANLVEVIKGPSAMVYGSESIGGIVNVDTGRVPKAAPSGGWDGRLDANLSDNSARQTAAGRIDFSAGNLVFHGDFDLRQGDDYDIPGCADSTYIHRVEEEEHHDEEEHEEGEDHDEEEHVEEHEEICGTLLNSYYDVFAGSFGGSYVNELGFVGLSYSSNLGDFGIPVPHAHGAEEHDEEEEHHEEEDDADHEEEEEHHDEEDETPRSFIDFQQERLDFDFRRDEVSDAIERLQIRFAMSEYQHDEIEEPGGPIDARFINDEYEFRIDAVLNRENTSVLGVHLTGRDYQVQTSEDPVLPVTESRLGLSWLHERQLGTSTLELGSRMEAKKVDSEEFGGRSFLDFALSLGLLSDPSRDWIFKADLSQSSRAPALEELASRGFHLSTSAVEVGNPDLGNESQTGFTVGASKQTGKLELDLTAYHRRFTDFIYIANSGEFDHGAPVFTYRHRNATFTGFDASAIYHLPLDVSTELDLRFQYDLVAVSVDRSTVNKLPQMPPARATVGLDFYHNELFASLQLSQNSAVNNPALLELPTDSWYDLSTRVEYTFEGLSDAMDGTVYLKGKNLTDEEQRNHISVIKDRVPLPGRMLEVGFRLSM